MEAKATSIRLRLINNIKAGIAILISGASVSGERVLTVNFRTITIDDRFSVVELTNYVGFLFNGDVTVLIVDGRFRNSQLMFHVRPRRTMAFLTLRTLLNNLHVTTIRFGARVFHAFSLALAISGRLNEEMVHMRGCEHRLPFASQPNPVERSVRHAYHFIPVTAVRVRAVLQGAHGIGSTRRKAVA